MPAIQRCITTQFWASTGNKNVSDLDFYLFFAQDSIQMELVLLPLVVLVMDLLHSPCPQNWIRMRVWELYSSYSNINF